MTKSLTNRFDHVVATFHMKSGNSISVRCDRISTKTGENGELASYKVEGMDPGELRILHLSPGEVEAVTTKRVYRPFFRFFG